jgi:GAF domain-containing protein
MERFGFPLKKNHSNTVFNTFVFLIKHAAIYHDDASSLTFILFLFIFRALQVIGALQMVNKLSGEAFNKDDEDILSAFCAQAAIAIVNSQLYQETSELNAYMQSIMESINHFVLHIGIIFLF